MKYYIIAGEASGDLHGSNLMKALIRKDQDANIVKTPTTQEKDRVESSLETYAVRYMFDGTDAWQILGSSSWEVVLLTTLIDIDCILLFEPS